MSLIKPLFVGFTLLTVLFLTVAPGLAQDPSFQPSPPTPSAIFAPGEVVVKFQPHVGMRGAQNSMQATGLNTLQVLPNSGMLRVQVPPGQEAEAIAELMARGDVEFATYNYYVEALGDPNDTYYSTQWALPKIDAPEAWDIYTGADNIIVAILDTGVDLDHPDLSAKIVPGYDYVNDDTEPQDDHGHGTHVAGIAAAASNNSRGVAGVSWGARIMPVKVLNSGGGGYTADVAEGIYFAVDSGARVINMSLGAKYSKWPCAWTDIETAFNYAVSHDVLVVVSAGNDGQNGVNCPGAYDQVMAVGATSSGDTRSYYSNYGPRLDIAAPGDSIYSTILNDTYTYKSGTSMAAPHVAGLAALVWSLAPSLDSNQVRNIIQNNATDLLPAGWDQQFGYGRINARRSMEALILQTPAQMVWFIDPDGPTSKSISVTTFNPGIITWTTTISPAVSWLNVSPPASGAISAASSPGQIMLLANTSTITFADTPFTATVLVSGTTASGIELGPRTTEVQLYYFPKVFEYRLPLIFKQ
ncbi:MAG: peptidase S8 [Anaerolineae bacterium]|nr:peptidase S8 [Anaerolineae bacterium]